MLAILGGSAGFSLVAALLAALCRRSTRNRNRALRWTGLLTSLCLTLAAVLALAVAGYVGAYVVAGQPAPESRTLADGVQYERRVASEPFPQVIHIVRVDPSAGAKLRLSPPVQIDRHWRHRAATVGETLRESGGLLAINASFFQPFEIRTPIDFTPQPGDPVTPSGTTIHDKKIYGSKFSWPMLSINAEGKVAVTKGPLQDTLYAVSGSHLLVRDGVVFDRKDPAMHPRTAVGVDRESGTYWLVVVDGRQPWHSEGATFSQLAMLFKELGATDAINLDGGGSSTMAWRTGGGDVRLLNRPIHTKIPGRQRPVANCLILFPSEDRPSSPREPQGETN